MSLGRAVRRELGKVYFTMQVGLGVLFYVAARRTGRSYNAVAETYVDQTSATLMTWLESLPPGAAVAVVTVPMAAYAGWKLLYLVDMARASVRRNGLLRTIGYASVLAVGLALVAEERPELLVPGGEMQG